MAQPPQDPHARIAELETLISRIRHDVRSALAPAMLAADMMQASTDPRVQRSGATVVRAIERVLVMLDSTRETVPGRPTEPSACARS